MKLNIYLLLAGCLLLSACGGPTIPASVPTDEAVALFPDYTEVTIPVNIAPLNFRLQTPHDDAYVRLRVDETDPGLVVHEEKGQFTLPMKPWQELLERAAGKQIEVQLFAHQQQWVTYAPFQWQVSADPIDPYIAYRLIEPGYELWGQMGIYQRCLTDYEQSAIIENRQTEQNCMNCHSFCMQDPNRMLFHMREKHAGTYLLYEGKMEKLDTKTDQTISPLVYPSWHPSGRYVAFSVNTTRQDFHTHHPNRIEVFDTASDVVVYDVQQHRILATPLLKSEQAFETFPTFSPDGRSLYFSTAPAAPMPDSIASLHYHLCRIDFDPERGRFGTQVDTIYNVRAKEESMLFPRISPDGRYLLCTRTAYGTFPIWHRDADLCLIDLQQGQEIPLESWNSHDTDSYHSWSSNSRWVVFSSRRLDGLYTRPFLAYIGPEGELGKPFLLPQRHTNDYQLLMKSFNVPELIRGKVSPKHLGVVSEKK